MKGSLFPPLPREIDDELFPQFENMWHINSLYIVMEKCDNAILSQNTCKPISIHENYNEAKLKCVDNLNRYVIGPVPYYRSTKLSMRDL